MFGRNKFAEELIRIKDKKIEELKSQLFHKELELSKLENKIKDGNEILKMCRDNNIDSKKLSGFLKLKNCRYCGADTFINKTSEIGTIHAYPGSSHPYSCTKYTVCCTKCHAHGPQCYSIDEAIKSYNGEEETKDKKSTKRKIQTSERTINHG